MPMNCPICGSLCPSPVPARHLAHFFRCPRCTGYYHAPGENASYSESYFFESSSAAASATRASGFLSIFLWFRRRRIRKLLPAAGGKILDYGCGNGKLIAYLRTRDFAVAGYDPSASAVALAARDRLPVYSSIPDERYDLIMAWHSLEHSDTPLADVRQWKRYLAPAGKVLIAVPNADGFESRLTGENWFCYDWPFHRVHFTPCALAMLLEEAGFRVTAVDYVNFEYTLSSLAQTFLNLFFPKNVFYSAVSQRRGGQTRGKQAAWVAASFAALIFFSPALLLIFVAELLAKRTAAFIVVAERNA